MDFSLVSTVFNEARRLELTIRDIENQTLKPSEIIITDAGSTDGTYEMLEKWALESEISIVVLQKLKCNVAEGRNIAIKNTKYDIIASTDFGCRFEPSWLESIITPFSDPTVEVVGGAFTVKESDIITPAAKAEYILSNGYNINVNSGTFIPSSRSIAYRKYVFDRIGGYCEWLTLAGDDMVFGLEIQARNYKTINVPRPNVSWGRHEQAKGYIKEMFRYGLGNGEAHVDQSNTIKYSVFLFLRILFGLNLICMAFSAILRIPIIIPLVIFAITAYAFRPYLSFVKRWYKFRSEKYDFNTLICGFGLYEKMKISYIKGYIKGYYSSTSLQKDQAILLKARLAKN